MKCKFLQDFAFWAYKKVVQRQTIRLRCFWKRTRYCTISLWWRGQRISKINEQQFLDAVAVAMTTPGPVVITVGFIGYLVAGVPGACGGISHLHSVLLVCGCPRTVF